MKNKPDECTRQFGAEVLCRHLDAMQSQVDGVRAGKDIEAVHDMRVATRRFRSTLPLFANSFSASSMRDWKNDIKKITRALGEARDTDVKLERLKDILNELTDKNLSIGLHRLQVRLKQERDGYQVKIYKALDHIEQKHTITGIRETVGQYLPPSGEPLVFSSELYRTAFSAIDHYRDELLAYDAIVEHPEQKEALHAMRIASKHLRYALEAFAPIYPASLLPIIKIVRTTQDKLGDLHDYDVWDSYLIEYWEKEKQRTLDYYGYTWPINRHAPGIEYLSHLFQERRQKVYEEFHALWHTWKEDGTWDALDRIIRIPVSINIDVFPLPADHGISGFQGNQG